MSNDGAARVIVALVLRASEDVENPVDAFGVPHRVTADRVV
jgi:hypothetical protein